MLNLLGVIILGLPFEAAFVDPYTGVPFDDMKIDQKFFAVLNRQLDVFFGIDLVLQFFLGYRDPSTLKTVTSLSKIRNRYLTGW